MSRITHYGQPEQPRRTFETTVYRCQEWPEHIARCERAIKQRKLNESCVVSTKVRSA